MNFTDILGTLVQSGLSKSGRKRLTNILDGVTRKTTANADIASSLGKMLGEAKGAHSGRMGELAGAIFGGKKKTSKGSVGGGALAMLATLALSALSRSGGRPTSTPAAEKQVQNITKQQLESDAELIVRAMINAAKVDGNIDDAEVEKIVGKLEEGGLTREEKDFFISETKRPMDMDTLINSAENKPDLAAQIYTASLLAIEVDTPAEKAYMEKLANGLNIHPQVVAQLEKTAGLF